MDLHYAQAPYHYASGWTLKTLISIHTQQTLITCYVLSSYFSSTSSTTVVFIYLLLSFIYSYIEKTVWAETPSNF